MHPSTIRAIYRRLQAANPAPTTELEHSSPFELLVAVMLSAHTTDKSVNTATRVLYPIANTPQAILAMGVEGVKPYLKSVGLYNTKAKNLIELCRRIVEQHGGEIPRERAALESLPGVGRKTANIILNMVFGESTIAVDTHIFRVANRTGVAPGKNPEVVENELNDVTPDEYKKNAHHWLLLHGRYVCTARLPACPRCIIADLCEYTSKTAPLDLPRSDAPVTRASPSRTARTPRATAKRAAKKAAQKTREVVAKVARKVKRSAKRSRRA
jgi:endonuclease-3